LDGSIGGQLWDGTSGALNNFGKTIESANESYFDNTNCKLCRCYWAPGTYRGTFKILVQDQYYEPMVSIIGWRIWTRFRAICKSATWVKLRELSLSYKLNLTIKFRFRKCYIHWNRKKLMVVD
jgi:hypothetical protein